MNTDSFYLHLNSKDVSSQKLYRENTATVFRNVLHHPLSLNSTSDYYWEVALVDLIIPNGFFNVTQDMTEISLAIEKEGGSYVILRPPIEIPPGFYDPYSYCLAINEECRRMKPKMYKFLKNKQPAIWSKITGLSKEEGTNVGVFQNSWPNYKKQLEFEISYIPQNMRFMINTNKSLGEIALIGHASMRDILGFKFKNTKAPLITFKNAKTPLITDQIMGEQAADFCKFYNNMYVYCDIVKYSLIGSQIAPILRVFHLGSILLSTFNSSNSGSREKATSTQLRHPNLNPSFMHRQYVEVNSNLIKEITISMNNVDGTPFYINSESENGTFITLHFRKVHYK